MAASVQYRQQERSLLMTVMREKDDDLALFLEMQSHEKKKIQELLLHNADDFHDQLGSKKDIALISKIASALPARRTGAADEFLNSENDKNDYDWLLTPPATPLFPSLEMESNKTVMSQIGISNGHPAAPKTGTAYPPAEPASRNNGASKQPISSTGSNTSTAENRRPSSSGGMTTTVPRSATPTGRATFPATKKSSRSSTPTSRATLPTTAKPSRSSTPTSRTTLPTTVKHSRSSTPTSRTTLLSIKTAALPVRSSTPTRPVIRSSTPTARTSVPAASKSTSRSATPTHRSSTPSRITITSGPKMLKNSMPSRGTSPTVKSRPWKLSELPGFSHDAPPKLKISMPERPASASRARLGTPIARSSSTETISNGRPRQQSCSPSRRQAPNGSVSNNGRSVLPMSRANVIGSDDANPVLMGTKMVERVVNMRKLAPPKQDEYISKDSNSSEKSSSSQDNSGFGRTLSKNSLDMALRHMDIRRSISGNLRPLMTNIPASSMYSVRSGSMKSISVSDSPLATSSNASSEPSVNNNSHYLDGSEVEDIYFGNERDYSSPTIVSDV